MNLYIAEFDTTCITLYANNKHDAMCVILEDCNKLGLDINWKTLNDKEIGIYIKWTDTHNEDITITEVNNNRGIIAVESI